jgi:hypothetical protein
MQHITLIFLVIIFHQSSVGQDIVFDANGQNVVEWIKDRKLNWEDFKGIPPSITETNASANTNCGFDVSAESNGNKELMAVRIKNIFYCDKSWVRMDKKHRLDLLEHEQAHFDLCEVYARRLRKRVEDSNYKLDIDNAIFEVFEAFKKRQKLYDQETNHSRNKEKQVEWLNIIAHELLELDNYSI